ncbi:MAG TPA: EFR1 family ferrodoxin [Clostridiales bacterium]|nr:MAG: ferredoxin [Firmicutes bacterium ADurb.Bin262]HOU09924.1 EFR1 family ferrodoxin [Clostridiales bacterium]HQH63011.1 EFR1 family ferrodoxin [Clostridiales bacterium]HQK72985.1 EFR1 family ferrodoxin [Clostridiales bacterium]
MIFWFSGTGNSLYAAKKIAEAQGESLISVAAEFDQADNRFTYRFKDGELLGFVWPVYAWAPPALVRRFIRQMKIEGSPFAFSVSTCGSDEGRATTIVEKALEAKGLKLGCALSLQMPSNYIIGGDVCAAEQEQRLLAAAEEKLDAFNKQLAERRAGVFDLLPGKMPALLTGLVNPLFDAFARSTGRFYATDACNTCGLCERVCPVHTVKVSGKPSWGKECAQCLACINRCPRRAIEYGRATVKRGRYVHPCLRPPGQQE